MRRNSRLRHASSASGLTSSTGGRWSRSASTSVAGDRIGLDRAGERAAGGHHGDGRGRQVRVGRQPLDRGGRGVDEVLEPGPHGHGRGTVLDEGLELGGQAGPGHAGEARPGGRGRSHGPAWGRRSRPALDCGDANHPGGPGPDQHRRRRPARQRRPHPRGDGRGRGAGVRRAGPARARRHRLPAGGPAAAPQLRARQPGRGRRGRGRQRPVRHRGGLRRLLVGSRPGAGPRRRRRRRRGALRLGPHPTGDLQRRGGLRRR